MVDKSTFLRFVHDAFDHLDDRPFLATHPLARLLGGGSHLASPEVLRRALVDTVDELRPPDGTPAGSASWRRWRGMRLRYVDGASTKHIARELQISDRQALRDHIVGVEAIAEVLWARIETSARFGGRQPGTASPRRAGPELESGPLAQEDLETELARVAFVPDGSTTSAIAALEGALATVRSLADERQARLNVAFPQDLRPVTLSETIVRQAFLCLLSASIIDGIRPRVQIDAANSASCIHVAFTVGVAPPRQSSPTSVAADRDSLIDTARRLVQPEGGDLQVRTSRGARGFRRSLILTLPTAPTLTALVIDDNPDMAGLFRWYLTGGNYYVVQARTPPTALELARSLNPDVILLDIMMPSQDGWQILQQLRDDPSTQQVPIIICSILPERPLARSLGVAEFLAKPITQDDLLAALERCLGAAGLPGRPDSLGDTSSARQW